jgi:hypothetical protein
MKWESVSDQKKPSEKRLGNQNQNDQVNYLVHLEPRLLKANCHDVCQQSRRQDLNTEQVGVL